MRDTRGRFLRGPDPGRHQLTDQERLEGKLLATQTCPMSSRTRARLRNQVYRYCRQRRTGWAVLPGSEVTSTPPRRTPGQDAHTLATGPAVRLLSGECAGGRPLVRTSSSRPLSPLPNARPVAFPILLPDERPPGSPPGLASHSKPARMPRLRGEVRWRLRQPCTWHKKVQAGPDPRLQVSLPVFCHTCRPASN
jgi:hypothetical protein